jgi:hypothetical protein
MKNGLNSVHIWLLDGVKGRASFLRDGALLGGDPYFWSIGFYTGGNDLEGRSAHQPAHAPRATAS